MNYKQIEKATMVLAKIKALDDEIIEIDNMAVLIANGDVSPEFQLKIKVPKDPKNKENDGENTSDVKLMYHHIMVNWGIGYTEDKRNNTANEKSITKSISESAALKMLGVLLQDKHEQRQKLITQLQKMGVNQ